jgi:ribosomal protein S2
MNNIGNSKAQCNQNKMLFIYSNRKGITIFILEKNLLQNFPFMFHHAFR